MKLTFEDQQSGSKELDHSGVLISDFPPPHFLMLIHTALARAQKRNPCQYGLDSHYTGTHSTNEHNFDIRVGKFILRLGFGIPSHNRQIDNFIAVNEYMN